MRVYYRWFCFAFSIAMMCAIFFYVDTSDSAAAFSMMDWRPLTLAIAALSLTPLVAALRFWSVLGTFGTPMRVAVAVKATMYGLVGSLLFFNVVGQSLTRWSVLRAQGLSMANVVGATLYERVLALGLLALLALTAALGLFGDVITTLLARLDLRLVLAAAACLWIGWRLYRRLMRVIARSVAGHLRPWRLMRDGAFTLLVHATTFAAFMTLISELAPMVGFWPAARATIVTMLAAALPISFAGWGVRELSAVFALGQIGVDAPEALAISVTVGVISTAVTVFYGAGAWFAGLLKPIAVSTTSRAETLATNDLSKVATVLLPSLVGATLWFHVWLPTGEGFVNAVLADALVLLGGLIGAAVLARRDRLDQQTSRFFWIPIAAITAVFGLGLVNGYLRFGYSDWAFINRGFGYLVIMGYLFTGLLVRHRPEVTGFALVGRLIIACLVAITLVDLLFFTLFLLGAGGYEIEYGHYYISGEAVNRNTFAFQIVVAVCCTLAFLRSEPSSRRSKYLMAALCILSVAMFFTKSRTGIVTCGAIFFIALATGWLAWRRGVIIATVTVAAILAVTAALSMSSPRLQHSIAPAVNGMTEPRLGVVIQDNASDSDRWGTLRGGWEMFLDHPLTGAGLGAFMAQTTAAGEARVIHSTFVWLLAEFGGLGALVVLGAWGTMLWLFATRARSSASPAPTLGTLLLVAAAIFGLPHDIYFQRAFWFVLGLCAAATTGDRALSAPSQQAQGRALARDPS